MIVSLRLPLIAGTVAAVSAGAVAVAPAGHPERLAQALAAPFSAPVALTSLANPFDQLLGTLDVAQNYLFGSFYNGGDAPTPGAGEANWTLAGFDQAGGDVLNFLLAQEKPLGFNNFVGNVPNTVANASPIVQQLQINLSGYLNTGLTGLIGAGAAVSTGVWEYPAALISAAELALQGEITQAIGVLVDAVVVPATAAAGSLIAAGAEIGGAVIARLGAVIAAVPQIVTTFAGWALGGTALLAERTAGIATTWFSQLAALDLEGAWNTAVEGLLGPSGLPGLALNLAMGAGVQTGPILNPVTDIAGNFVPSLRTGVNGAVWSVQDAMTAIAPPVAQARSAAAVPAVEAAPDVPAVEAVAVAAAPAVAAELVNPRTAVAQAAEAQAGQAQTGGADTAAADAGSQPTAATAAATSAASAATTSRGSAAANRKSGVSAVRDARNPRAQRASTGD